MSKNSVLICDHNTISRNGLKCILQGHPHLSEIILVKNQEELESIIKRQTFDVFLIDYQKSEAFGMGSLAFIRERFPAGIIIVCTADLQKNNIFEAIEYGINAFITKEAEENELFMAIDKALVADRYFASPILDIIINQSFNSGPAQKSEKIGLTNREVEIVKQIASGKVAKEISEELNLSVHTIYTHRKNIMKKLNFSSPVELIMYAMNEGLFEE